MISLIIFALLSFMNAATFWSSGESMREFAREPLGRGREGSGGWDRECPAVAGTDLDSMWLEG